MTVLGIPIRLTVVRLIPGLVGYPIDVSVDVSNSWPAGNRFKVERGWWEGASKITYIQSWVYTQVQNKS